MTQAGNGPLFVVDSSQTVANTLKRYHAEEAKQGKGEQFVVALRALYERLQRNSRAFGDPLYRLPLLKLMVYIATVAPLIVHYAVHDERAMVFIKRVYKMPG